MGFLLESFKILSRAPSGRAVRCIPSLLVNKSGDATSIPHAGRHRLRSFSREGV